MSDNEENSGCGCSFFGFIIMLAVVIVVDQEYNVFKKFGFTDSTLLDELASFNTSFDYEKFQGEYELDTKKFSEQMNKQSGNSLGEAFQKYNDAFSLAFLKKMNATVEFKNKHQAVFSINTLFQGKKEQKFNYKIKSDSIFCVKSLDPEEEYERVGIVRVNDNYDRVSIILDPDEENSGKTPLYLVKKEAKEVDSEKSD